MGFEADGSVATIERTAQALAEKLKKEIEKLEKRVKVLEDKDR